MKNQLKKLTVNKETLRDLTARNAGEVKGGGVTRRGITCNIPTEDYRCPTNIYLCPTAGCHGKTFNKKCLR